MPPVIKVESLSKKYILSHQAAERYLALRDVMANGAKRLVGRIIRPKLKSTRMPSREDFWALKDVSFDINQGDRIGIIGRNGAGKSTLLKVLSRIIEPTSGRVSIKGRVASLLEVGTGFHPELTGRENIFLNGAILGMQKTEIKERFDEIVAFSEVEKFLDTPVKHYSSGMYVRLAFAVAAHLEPEILIVDEVLAVGDAQFQKKCLGKMEEAGKEGRTLLFVSHNMAAVQKLCNRAVLLQNGLILKNETTMAVINAYLEEKVNVPNEKKDLLDLPRKNGHGIKARIKEAGIFNLKGDQVTTLKFCEPFSIKLKCIGMETVKDLQPVIGINSFRQERIATLFSKALFDIETDGQIEITANITSLYLTPGQYTVTLGIRNNFFGIDHLENVLTFEVLSVKSIEHNRDDDELFFGLVHVRDAQWTINRI